MNVGCSDFYPFSVVLSVRRRGGKNHEVMFSDNRAMQMTHSPSMDWESFFFHSRLHTQREACAHDPEI